MPLRCSCTSHLTKAIAAAVPCGREDNMKLTMRRVLTSLRKSVLPESACMIAS